MCASLRPANRAPVALALQHLDEAANQDSGAPAGRRELYIFTATLKSRSGHAGQMMQRK